MKRPDVTVVTANLNSGGTLARCLDSVATQRGVHCHHVVVDGGSTDDSIPLLREKQGDSLRFSSGPDMGIADAMNKGAEMMQSDWILFLQADDQLSDSQSLSRLLDPGNGQKAGLVAGGIQLGQRLISTCPKGEIRTGWPFITPVKQPFRHQGLLVSRNAWNSVGPYDTSFQITMDFDWILRAWWSGISVIRVGSELAKVSSAGISSARGGELFRKRLKEEQVARLKNAPGLVWQIGYKLFWLLYRPYRITRTRLGA